ncbi:hypothetical protein AYI69_g1143 [Smittium culicis]|uniref:Uncharacterized protein n=1 Tax=Smittium culicis TaxID=133412 RepID=A0A1R1YR35_9FUNG|nr:hypothetical protein AYI69_g1143 [Smittium culicis]
MVICSWPLKPLSAKISAFTYTILFLALFTPFSPTPLASYTSTVPFSNSISPCLYHIFCSSLLYFNLFGTVVCSPLLYFNIFGTIV